MGQETVNCCMRLELRASYVTDSFCFGSNFHFMSRCGEDLQILVTDLQMIVILFVVGPFPHSTC